MVLRTVRGSCLESLVFFTPARGSARRGRSLEATPCSPACGGRASCRASSRGIRSGATGVRSRTREAPRTRNAGHHGPSPAHIVPHAPAPPHTACGAPGPATPRQSPGDAWQDPRTARRTLGKFWRCSIFPGISLICNACSYIIISTSI